MKTLAKKSTRTTPEDSQASTTDSAATSTASEATQAATSTTDDQAEQTTAVDPTQQITDLKAQLDAKDDQLLRAQAEIVNMQNRNKKEQAALLKYDGQALAKDVLPVLDNLERALATPADDEAAQQLKKGVEMVYGHLQDALKNMGSPKLRLRAKSLIPIFTKLFKRCQLMMIIQLIRWYKSYNGVTY